MNNKIKTGAQILDNIIEKIATLEKKEIEHEEPKKDTENMNDDSLIKTLFKRAEELGTEQGPTGAAGQTGKSTDKTGATGSTGTEQKKASAPTGKTETTGPTGATGQEQVAEKEVTESIIPPKIAEEYLIEVNKIVKEAAVGTLGKILLGTGLAGGGLAAGIPLGKAIEKKKDEPEDKAIFAYGQRVGATAFAKALLNKLRGKKSEEVK